MATQLRPSQYSLIDTKQGNRFVIMEAPTDDNLDGYLKVRFSSPSPPFRFVRFAFNAAKDRGLTA